MDERIGLVLGTKLRTKTKQYMIINEIGRGGSSIVYHALDSEEIPCLVKEFYPNISGLIRTETGLIGNPKFPVSLQNEIQAKLSLFYEKRATEQESILDIKRKLVEYIELPLDTFDCFGAFYSVFNARSLNGNESRFLLSHQIGEEKPLSICCTYVERILAALECLHKAGWLHLDLSPDNIIVTTMTGKMDVNDETVVPIIKLIDLDNSRRIHCDNTLKNRVSTISCKKGYSAPELLSAAEGEEIVLSQVADIFSVTAIFYKMLFGEVPTIMDQIRPSGYPFVSSEHTMFKGLPQAAIKLCNKILSQGLSHDPSLRESYYPDCLSLSLDFSELARISDTTKYSLRSNIYPPTQAFKGRDKQIEDIYKHFQCSSGEREGTIGGNVLLLQGIGGIGKTELALGYADYAMKQEMYDTVIFAMYNGSIRSLLLDDDTISIKNLQRPVRNQDNKENYLDEEQLYFKQKIDLLSDLASKRALIILDNFNTTNDSDLSMISNFKWDILITSRNDWKDSRYTSLEVGEITDTQALIDIYKFHAYPKAFDDLHVSCHEDDVIVKILDTIQRHTLLIGLIARLTRTLGISSKTMLTQLSDGIWLKNLNSSRVKLDKNNEISRDSIEGHLKTIFDLSNLSEDKINLLKMMTLTPVDGILPRHIKMMYKEEGTNILDELAQEGWVQEITIIEDEKPYERLHTMKVTHASVSEATKSFKVKLHPVISDFLFFQFGADAVAVESQGFVYELARVIFDVYVMEYPYYLEEYSEKLSALIELGASVFRRISEHWVCDSFFELGFSRFPTSHKMQWREKIYKNIKSGYYTSPIFYTPPIALISLEVPTLAEEQITKRILKEKGKENPDQDILEKLYFAAAEIFNMQSNYYGTLLNELPDEEEDAFDQFHYLEEIYKRKQKYYLLKLIEGCKNPKDYTKFIIKEIYNAYEYQFHSTLCEYCDIFCGLICEYSLCELRSGMELAGWSTNVIEFSLWLSRYFEDKGLYMLSAQVIQTCAAKYTYEGILQSTATLNRVLKNIYHKMGCSDQEKQCSLMLSEYRKQTDAYVLPGVLYTPELFQVEADPNNGYSFRLTKTKWEKQLDNADAAERNGETDEAMKARYEIGKQLISETIDIFFFKRRYTAYDEEADPIYEEVIPFSGGDYEYMAQVSTLKESLFRRLYSYGIMFLDESGQPIHKYQNDALKFRQRALAAYRRDLGGESPQAIYIINQIRAMRKAGKGDDENVFKEH